jgi:hypothetical protein
LDGSHPTAHQDELINPTSFIPLVKDNKSTISNYLVTRMPMTLTSLRIFLPLNNELCKNGLRLGLKQQQVGIVTKFPKVSPKSFRLLQMGVGTQYLKYD